MKYFKVINGDEFIGVATSYDLRKFQQKHQVVIATDIDHAQYLQVGDDFYHCDWFEPIVAKDVPYKTATITSIDEDEYAKLYKALDAGDIVEVREEPIPETTTTTPVENTTVERTVEDSPVDRIKQLEENQKLIQSAIDDLIMSNIGEGS